MSFITGGYRNATPIIQCPDSGFRSISPPISVDKSTKYRVQDNRGRNWVVYVSPVITVPYDATAFRQIDKNTLVGPSGFEGTIQLAKVASDDDSDRIYDKAAGSFVVEAVLTGSVTDSRGVYSLNYTKIGNAPLLMFILPHHIQSLDPDLKPQVTKLQLRTTTKGMATAIWADRLTFIEPNLPTTMGFGPWTPTLGAAKVRYHQGTLDLVAVTAEQDLRRAMAEQTPPDSMYYAGKTLAKFATLLWVMKDVLTTLSPQYPAGLVKLKKDMAAYVENRQQYPLFYDDSWKGIVSNAGFNDPGADFGNTYYNDHHFHFGYFVYACAVIGYLDPEWLTQGDNKAWCQMLVKDFAEADYKGRDYPFSRSFDWWNGHSWAKGLFESADGKDEESTSEDGFASFAVKMWGRVIGDGDMEKRGKKGIGTKVSPGFLQRAKRHGVCRSSANRGRKPHAGSPGPRLQHVLLPPGHQYHPPDALHAQQSNRHPLREQSRPRDLLRHRPGAHPRHPHVAPLARVGPAARQALCPARMVPARAVSPSWCLLANRVQCVSTLC
jgi:endo-1,3(4)-beta-glucanase